MTTITVGKWGNASALRIPKPFCQQLGIEVGSDVSLSLEGQRLIIEPLTEKYTLRARMKDWDGKRYIAQEYDWGEPAGKEIW